MSVQSSSSRLVWIASSPATFFRVRDCSVDSGAVFKLRKCNLNLAARTSAILAECRKVGIVDLDAEPTDHILAAGLVKPLFVFDALRNLTEAERMQKEFFQQLHHADDSLHGVLTFFEVCECVRLQAPMPVQRVGTRKARSFFAPMQEGQLDRLLSSLDESQVLQPPWLQSAVKQNCAHTMVQLPLPISLLVASGEWRRFCLCDMGGSLYKGWVLGACPLLWSEGELPVLRMPKAEVANVVHADTAARFVEDLQQIYEKACDMIGSDLGPEAAQRMLVIAASLQHHVAGMRVAYRNDAAVLSEGKETYNVYYLLHCFLLCDLLKADSSLAEAVRQACHIALPKHVKDVVLQLLDDGQRPVPSPATVSRLRLKVDVAWMLLQRRDFQQALSDGSGMVAHCMVDSSPQGGHDYELLHVTLVGKGVLAELHVEICKLERMKRLSMAERVNFMHEERRIMMKIYESIHMVTPPPVLLGMGKSRSSLGMKFHAAMHALYLLVGPATNLSKFVECIWTWVSDLGTEAGFSHVRKLNFRDLFPYIMDSEASADPRWHEEVDFADADASTRPEPEPSIGCEGSAAIPGLLHILHNCFLGLGGAMRYFQSIISQMKEVAKLLSQPESKERLLATCFTGPLNEALAADVRAFQGHVYEDRWGTVADCVLKLLPCQVSLQHAWDLDKFVMHRGGVSGGSRVGSVALDVAQDAITSTKFWAYLEMLACFASMQSRLSSWVESCPCHWDALHNSSDDIPKDLKDLWKDCPLRGRRAADISSGKLLAFVKELLAVSGATLLLKMPASIPHEDRADIVHDFENGRAHVLLQFALKMNHWGAYPWAGYASACHDVDKSPEVLRAALASECSHPQIAALRESTTKEEIDVFLEDPSALFESEDPHFLPKLRQWFASVQTICIAERRIEGKHAASKKGVTHAPHHSCPYVSLLHRVGEIKRFLEDNPQGIKLLASELAQVRSGLVAVKLLNLDLHPDVGLAKHYRDPVYARVIYHADTHVKYCMAQPLLPLDKPPPAGNQSPRSLETNDCQERLRLLFAQRHVKARFQQIQNSEQGPEPGQHDDVFFNSHGGWGFANLEKFVAPIKQRRHCP